MPAGFQVSGFFIPMTVFLVYHWLHAYASVHCIGAVVGCCTLTATSGYGSAAALCMCVKHKSLCVCAL